MRSRWVAKPGRDPSAVGARSGQQTRKAALRTHHGFPQRGQGMCACVRGLRGAPVVSVRTFLPPPARGWLRSEQHPAGWDPGRLAGAGESGPAGSRVLRTQAGGEGAEFSSERRKGLLWRGSGFLSCFLSPYRTECMLEERYQV